MAWREIGPHRIYRGAWTDVIDEVRGEVDALCSDPPYGMKANTDSTRFSGGSGSGRNRGRKWGPIVGDDRSFDPGPFLGFRRVALFGMNHFAARLPVGTTLVWVKRNDAAFGKFLSDAELVWMKGGHGVYCRRVVSSPSKTIFEACGKWPGQGGRSAHPTQKPLDIMDWVLRRLRVPAGGVVFDPFMGSGSTGVACVRLGLRFVGCEIVPEYFDAAAGRIDREVAATADARRLPTAA
ncbi:MAG: site-specific DNA-methyltransferase [Planctomycetota bacterium]